MAHIPKRKFDKEITSEDIVALRMAAHAITMQKGKSEMMVFFEGEKNEEFYKGMLAGSQAFMSIMNSYMPENFKFLSDMLLDLQRCIVVQID